MNILKRKPKVGAGPGNLTPFYNWYGATKMPTGGAMKYGFATEYLAWKPYIGPAIGSAKQFLNFSPNAYQHASANVTTGLGGIASGQIVLQPLSNPYV